jgi:Phosphoglucomutase/phosphomannomutase, alpha/beta/alpha domain I
VKDLNFKSVARLTTTRYRVQYTVPVKQAVHGGCCRLSFYTTMRRTLTNLFILKACLLQRVVPFRPDSTLWRRQNIDSYVNPQWLSSTSRIFRYASKHKLMQPVQGISAIYRSANSNTMDVNPDFETNQSMIIQTVRKLCNSGSDIRGRFVDHDETVKSLIEAMRENSVVSSQPSLTPFAAHCVGHAFVDTILQSLPTSSNVTVCIGVDPRTHGIRLADAFASGIRSYSMRDKSNHQMISIVFTGAATTPACASFVRSQLCDGAVVCPTYYFCMLDI